MNLTNDYTFETNPEAAGVAAMLVDSHDDGTSVSNMSDNSNIEPSFFIIPPRDLSTSVRHRRKAQPWERKNGNSNEAGNNDNLTITSSSSIFPETAYRRDRLMKDIDSAQDNGAEGYASILKTLKQAGIMIFIVDSKVSSTVSDILESIHNVILHSRKVQRTNQLINEIDDKKDGKICGGKGSNGDDHRQRDKAVCNAFSKNQWCLLYRDPEGRLFNLTLADHTAALTGQWQGLIQSFSVVQAMTLLSVLARNYSCATEGKFPSVCHFLGLALSMYCIKSYLDHCD
jgi:hypothetical protein